MSKPKVYFIGSSYYGCNYVRCLLPQIYGGYNGSQSSVYGELKSKQQVAEELNYADIVVFHRPDTPQHHKTAFRLQEMGKKIVFENDDTALLDEQHPFYELDGHGEDRNREAYKTIIDNFVKNADAVTTTTDFLANEYRKINKNVAVLPNCIDPDDWGVPQHNETDKVRIIISGSAAYAHDFEHIKDYLVELDARDDVQLVMFGLWGKKMRAENPLIDNIFGKENRFWDSLPNLEHIEYVDIKYYPDTLNAAKADIMLIPRLDSYFNRCKSNLKFLEASMCEIPVIAEGFSTKDSPYDLDNEHLLIATNLEEWKSATEKLIGDKELRLQLGREANTHVMENYDINKKVHLWEEFYSSLLSK